MAKQETKNEVAKVTKAPPPAAYQEGPSVVDSSDIVVPRLLLAQGISQAVADNKAKMGDIRNSLTSVVLGGPNEEVKFIPITIKKYWKKFEKVNGKNQFRGNESFNHMNANRARTGEFPSQANPLVKAMWEFDLTIDVFGFTEDDVQNPIALPTAISFSRTSYKAGQQVNTMLASVEAANLPYYAYMLSVGCDKKQNDKGIFYVFKVQPLMDGKKMVLTPEAYYPKIARWSKILTDSSRTIVVDDAGEDAVEAATPLDESRF